MKNYDIKPYKKEFDYSYASGAYATIELLRFRPEAVRGVFVHSQYNDKAGIEALCRSHGVDCLYGDKYFSRVNQKENSYVLGVFEKFECSLETNRPHVVLVNPSDMGNLGTIIRTMAGFDLYDLAIISPAADIFNPKTIRASMGSAFCVRHKYFSSFDEYLNIYGSHEIFTFMLNGRNLLNAYGLPGSARYSLVFGNEATGLSECFASIGVSVKIPQTEMVDSLNLSIAAAVGMFMFAGKR